MTKHSKTSTLVENDISSVGFFNYGNSYLRSAEILWNINVHRTNNVEQTKMTHPHAPIEFLLIHSVELFLKSYLRLDYDIESIIKHSHNLKKLLRTSRKQGLKLSEQNNAIIKASANCELNNKSRYLRIGWHSFILENGKQIGTPSIESLVQLANDLHNAVQTEIKNREQKEKMDFYKKISSVKKARFPPARE